MRPLGFSVFLTEVEQDSRRGLSSIRHGPTWLGSAWFELTWLELAWPGLISPGLVWSGLVWPGLAWPGLARYLRRSLKLITRLSLASCVSLHPTQTTVTLYKMLQRQQKKKKSIFFRFDDTSMTA
ncbi:hypothetical protein V1478_004787 [Vespula squamosa]|uniref:Uncharacterized protein n=1 Tax=Vespula squamosa TaxID=30214 RepID=A0ABD2BEQ4_VESSQ